MKKSLLILSSLFLYSMNVNALPINQVAYASLTGAELIDFEGVPAGGSNEINYDGIMTLLGRRSESALMVKRCHSMLTLTYLVVLLQVGADIISWRSRTKFKCF